MTCRGSCASISCCRETVVIAATIAAAAAAAVAAPQFSQITQVSFPPVYEKFLGIIGIFSFDLGWMLSAACVATGIGFYGKLL